MDTEKNLICKQFELERVGYEDDKTFWKGQIEKKDKEIKDIHEFGTKMIKEKSDEITSVIRNLIGSSSAIGKFGENFIQKVHSQMNLGTYTDDSHNKNPGFADGTWTLPSQGIGLSCLSESKLVETLNSIKDIKKFEDDTRTASQLGRINQVFFSASLLEFLENQD